MGVHAPQCQELLVGAELHVDREVVWELEHSYLLVLVANAQESEKVVGGVSGEDGGAAVDGEVDDLLPFVLDPGDYLCALMIPDKDLVLARGVEVWGIINDLTPSVHGFHLQGWLKMPYSVPIIHGIGFLYNHLLLDLLDLWLFLLPPTPLLLLPQILPPFLPLLGESRLLASPLLFPYLIFNHQQSK